MRGRNKENSCDVHELRVSAKRLAIDEVDVHMYRYMLDTRGGIQSGAHGMSTRTGYLGLQQIVDHVVEPISTPSRK